MKILYIFPHPDDESFGPGPVIARQVREGHAVHLLTLTRGGATQQRHKHGYSIEKMGDVRRAEMQDVARVLGLAELTVLDLPDSGLKELDPREIEAAVAAAIRRVQPAVAVTYPAHGISGFPDHLVAHAVVKRVFLELRDDGAAYLRRLAFFTLPPSIAAETQSVHRLKSSTEAEIDCIMEVKPQDIEKGQAALDCYPTYQEMIEAAGVRRILDKPAHFEIFQEDHTPPLADLVQGLSGDGAQVRGDI